MTGFSDQIFKTKVVAITQGPRQELLARLKPSASLDLRKQPTRAGEAHQVAVYQGDMQLGWLKKEVSAELLKLLDQGIRPRAWIDSVTRAREGHLECHIEVHYQGPAADIPGIRGRARKGKTAPAPRPSASRQVLFLGAFLLASFLAAGIGGALTASAVSDWYPTLDKPPYNPPDWIFGPVWTFLYILMAVAGWWVWRVAEPYEKKPAMAWYCAQLLLNTLWSGFFFGLRSPLLGLLELSLFWPVLVMTVRSFWGVSRLGGLLMLPYLAWVSFAWFLNASIWWMNR
jgi:tryptophan-rich sensory protein